MHCSIPSVTTIPMGNFASSLVPGVGVGIIEVNEWRKCRGKWRWTTSDFFAGKSLQFVSDWLEINDFPGNLNAGFWPTRRISDSHRVFISTLTTISRDPATLGSFRHVGIPSFPAEWGNHHASRRGYQGTKIKSYLCGKSESGRFEPTLRLFYLFRLARCLGTHPLFYDERCHWDLGLWILTKHGLRSGRH